MQPRDIHTAIRIFKKEVEQWRVPAVGHYTQTPFTVLISCVLSLRTQDKTTHEASKRLFKLARTPKTMAKLAVNTIEKTIYPVGFYKNKAKNIIKICALLLSQHEGRVPDDIDELLKFPGVGRKTANMVMVNWFGQPGIILDTHVVRVSRRIGLTDKNKNQLGKMEADLMEAVAKKNWSTFSHILVFHGRRICVARKPRCERCKISNLCDYYRWLRRQGAINN